MLRTLSAGSTLHGLRACVASAAQTIGAEIDVATDHGHNIRDAALRGTANADVVLLPADMTDALADKGLARDPIALGRVSIGGAMRDGARAPAISTMATLRAALLGADAILLTNAPTGDHLMTAIARMGLTDVVAPKLRRFDTSAKLLAHLGQGNDSALGFSPETEIRAGRGISWIGDVPDEIQIALPYAAAMLTRTAQTDTARAFLAYLGTALAREAFARTGVRVHDSKNLTRHGPG